jgi:hypothetical protein
MAQVDRGCVKTSARFRTDLFRSFLRGLKAFRIEKIAKNFALPDPLQIFAEFSHGLDPLPSFPISPIRAEDARKGRRRYGQPCGRVQIRGELEPRLGGGRGRQMPPR